MTITTPTLEQFLAEPGGDEDDEPTAQIPAMAPYDPSPLDSIADSLARLVNVVEYRDLADTAEGELQQRYSDLDQAYADLEDKARTLYELVEEIEAIVKPSTSKLANSVREAVARWRAPEIPAEPVTEEPEPAVVPVENATEMGLQPPACDANPEAWREYARSLGYQGADVDQMNRSQIRTMLGIPHDEGST